MIPTKDEYKIVSEYLVSLVDWKKIYKDTAPRSKKMFSKEHIVKSIKKLILEYPKHFDTSCLEGRVETSVSTLAVKKGLLNNYLYIFSDLKEENHFSWFMTDDKLLDKINEFKKKHKYCVIINIKQTLRNYKIRKICQTITPTTNLVQE